MPEPTSAKQKFDLLPEAMRTWLTSSKVVDVVIELNNRYGVSADKLSSLPHIITRLCVGEILAPAFIAEVKQALGISQIEAEKVVVEIKTKILNPIAGGLNTISGVKLQDIPGPDPVISTPVGMEITHPQSVDLPASQNVVNLRAQAPVGAGSSSAPATPNIPGSGARPFMLHEEAPQKPLPQQQKESFSFHVPVNVAPLVRQTPAKFGSSFEEMLKKPIEPETSRGGDSPKVVHYHAYRSLPKLTEKEPRKG